MDVVTICGHVYSIDSLEINLTHKQITHLPPEIGQLKQLRILELGWNKLTSLPAEIGQLTNLTRLALSDNQLTSLPAEIGQLTQLKELYLHDNKLTSLPAEIGQLTNLTWLVLNNNQLTCLPAEIGQLTQLRVLNLSHNKIQNVANEYLTYLTQYITREYDKICVRYAKGVKILPYSVNKYMYSVFNNNPILGMTEIEAQAKAITDAMETEEHTTEYEREKAYERVIDSYLKTHQFPFINYNAIHRELPVN